MNSKNKLDINDTVHLSFFSFTDKILTDKYSERWRNLFNKGIKGWSKIDVWQAWENDFSTKTKLSWKKDLSLLIPFLKEYEITKFTFFGIGHNKPTIETCTIEQIETVLKSNIEGVIVTDNNSVAIVANHDGEILIFDLK